MQIAIISEDNKIEIGTYAILFPQITFPLNGPTEDWKKENKIYDLIDYLEYDSKFEYLVQCEPYLTDKGMVCNVEIKRYTEEELIENINGTWDSIRQIRNQKLLECDWTVLPNTPTNKLVWITYRQALRDITKQHDPYNLIWPIKP